MTGGRARRGAAVALAAGLASVVAVAGCRPPPMTELGLAEVRPPALVTTEPVRLDLGTDGARTHLGQGWSFDERNRKTGETFVWSLGPASELRFHLGWRRDLTLDLRARPFAFPGAPPQTLAFELNGRSLGPPQRLPGNGAGLSVRLPADAQAVGDNRLLIRYGRVDAPADVVAGSTDRRPLAVAWSEITVGGVDPTPPLVTAERIDLPAGGRVDSFLELESGARLGFDGCAPLWDEPVVVEVTITGDDGRADQVERVACPGGPTTVLIGSAGGLSRVRIAVRPADPLGRPTGARLDRPRILVPAARVDLPGPAAPTDPTGVASSDRPRPNVVVYLVDALRADRIGVYGCDRPLTPRLDKMAADGVVFADMTAQSSWTKAAVASIFTGLWPRAHGVNGPDDRLPDELPTLPELLRAAGYETGAVVANAYVGRPFGFARGFDHFEFIDHREGRSEVVHERVAAWLVGRGNHPFFLYVHTIDPHAPYAPPTPFLEAFAGEVSDPTVGRVETVRGLVLGTVEPDPSLERDLRALYDAEVAANDASFGRLLDLLEARGELEDTLVVFTSDHGEAFGEHGSWTHGLDLYDEVLSVPLVMRLPGRAGAGLVVRDPVQHVDLLPTILDRCGVVSERPLPGARLLRGDGVAGPGADRTVLAYLDYWGRHGAAALRGGFKLIRPLSAELGDADELYDRSTDRGETRDLADQRPVRSGWLAAELAAGLATRGESRPTEVADEVREQLEALGYLQVHDHPPGEPDG
ncbi:MAG: sulfatase [Thermoanaerobaculales bacterium]|jgi:arylsulfatase A-like enzyme|nr:sulfatase [Thermoanaerobaculales bacterium]